MRTSCIERNTKETQISLLLNLDGGDCEVDTGIGFFDHMLTAFSVHGGFGLKLTCRGDLNVDCHHTIEDVGIALGKAFSEALGDKGGIMRYGSFFIPMDEALGFCAADISGRPFLVFEASFPEERIDGVGADVLIFTQAAQLPRTEMVVFEQLVLRDAAFLHCLPKRVVSNHISYHPWQN